MVEMSKDERADFVRTLVTDDFKAFSDKQLQLAAQERITRINENARKRVQDALKDEHKRIAESMSVSPFFYLGPEIKVMAGCSVRFSSLMKVQSDDAYAQLDKFVGSENPSDMRVADHLSKHLLAHSLTQFNGADFGGVRLDAAEYQELRQTNPGRAEEVLRSLRDKRLLALGNLSPHMYQRLVEYYHVFQLTLEAITHSQEMDEALGN